MISIIIPTLNEEKFLPRLLQSLVTQTSGDFEVIVVDGASRDKTVSQARRFAKKLPHLTIKVLTTASLPLQRNEGVKETHGDWFVFVDADGQFLPYFIERVSSFIQKKHPSFFTTWFFPDSDLGSDAILVLMINLVLEAFVLFRRPNVTPGQLAIVSRKAYDDVGGYDEDHAFTEDLDLSLRLYKAGYAPTLLRETLCIYSLRRFRREGKLRVLQAYAKAAVAVLLTRRAPKFMPGYIMGGHLYNKRKKPAARTSLRQYEAVFKKLIRELFE